jgi:hypothetical protein
LAELPIVKIEPVALAFSMIGVPGVALVVKDLTTTEFPFNLNVPLEVLAPQVIAFSEPTVEFKAPELPKAKTPELMVTPVVNKLDPESVTTRLDEVAALPTIGIILVPIELLMVILPSPSKVRFLDEGAAVMVFVKLRVPPATCVNLESLFKRTVPE